MWTALRERLPVWVQVRCGLTPKSLAALSVVLIVAVGLAVQQFWTGRPEPVRAPERVVGPAPPAQPVRSPGSGRTPSPATGAGPSGVPAPSPSGGIVVDVSGKVRRPGIHRLPTGSRVADALDAAGGVRDGVDTTGLNRARVLMDGEQVVVGMPGVLPGVQAGGAGGVSGSVSGGGGSAGAGAAGPVSLNSASVDQLDALPGVGPVLAQHIVDYRVQHGGFRSVGELRHVNGIGDRRFADLQSLVRL
ncbi:helix-hairpin-helix domain-containing protein [Streptomyces sp. CBMA152]|uniref:helix-hairpin-helix domain-containing protein n=1 Tax=Streptomyces sp. CBMA152 TaxID=1896312 RepID=UPI002948C19D|nr:helix-hairpin-helix domain-containing protein [Streptomyces sp. CBMA152]